MGAKGGGGGPKEDNVTAFLVRSTAAGWKKGCLLAVDAGVHLASITNILETHDQEVMTDSAAETETVTLVNGPFQGLEIPHVTSKANAAFITRSLVDTYLITHPHLDHISGFVVNTAALPGLRPKKLAGLPYTIDAFKKHIFNNIIWPNLSDENGGAGLVTYMRLKEGGSPFMGDGDSKGYAEVCEGLSVKGWSVSHGNCMSSSAHNHSSPSGNALPSIREPTSSPHASPSMLSANRPRPHRSNSSASFRGSLSPGQTKEAGGVQVYDSSTYFIRDIATGREIVIFGDVEPDSLSSHPRNHVIWSEAAPKIASGSLTGIFIECSYDESREVDELFGHLAPRFLIEELKVLAHEVRMCRRSPVTSPQKKRKVSHNSSSSISPPLRRKQPARNGNSVSNMVDKFSSPSRRNTSTEAIDTDSSPENENRRNGRARVLRSTSTSTALGDDAPLKGVKVVAIHVKDKLDDGPDIGELILSQLREYEKSERLGCEFVIASKGQAVYF